MIGVAIGIIIGFCQLLPFYVRKEWDLHVVIPKSLLVHLFTIVISLVILLLFEKNLIKIISINIGISLGGLLAIIAYMGEVEKEHKVDQKEDIALV